MNDEHWLDQAHQRGLRATLAEVAAGQGVDLVDIPPEHSPRQPDEVVLSDPRGFTYVHARAAEFTIRIGADHHTWAIGATPSLPDVVGVIALWRLGATLDGLHTAFPFMTPDPYGRAVENGTVPEHGWSQVLDPVYVFVLPLLQAAHANPRLARLYPSVTHHRLVRFGLDGRNRAAGEIYIRDRGGDAYEISATFTDEQRVVVGIADAVAAAAALAPA